MRYPRTDPPTVVMDEDKARKWLSVGAQPSDAVQRFIDKMGAPEEAPTAEVSAEPEPSADEDAEAAGVTETISETETASAE